jgi:hypothetical protein
MNVYQEKIINLIDKEYVTNPISYIHNTNYNKKVKSVHKRKTNTNCNRYITYTSYEIYRLSKLPDKEFHLNFVSFLKISFYIFQEITRIILFHNLLWKIPNIGDIKCYTKTSRIVDNDLPKEYIKLNENKIDGVKSHLKKTKTTSLYVRRFNLKFRYSIRAAYYQDYTKYNETFVHKKIKKVYTI